MHVHVLMQPAFGLSFICNKFSFVCQLSEGPQMSLEYGVLPYTCILEYGREVPWESG